MSSHPRSEPSSSEPGADLEPPVTGEQDQQAGRPPVASTWAYSWLVVGLLWFCGFFNYADRQAVNSVFPLLQQEFSLTDVHLGAIGMAFMVVYAVTSPFAGYVVDRVSRRLLIPVGLAIWSLIAAATGLARSFSQLLFFRGAEGLGESFYFPASVSFLADYHGGETRSRALGIHQTSVYVGTAGGAALAGRLAKYFGWRSPFLVLGLVGAAYALALGFILVEPARGQSEKAKPGPVEPLLDDGSSVDAGSDDEITTKVIRVLSNRRAVMLLGVFIGANFVAAAFLTWLPTFFYRTFSLDIADSSLTSTVWPLASLVGAVCGGWLADLAARRHRGGRILVQSAGLILGAPFVFLTGWSASLGMVVFALAAAGLCKGIYDANIFASLFDVIAPADRGTAAGLMNSVGWTGGSLAPLAVGFGSMHFGLGLSIALTAAVYLVVGGLALLAAFLVETEGEKAEKA
jgi:MFS family permease